MSICTKCGGTGRLPVSLVLEEGTKYDVEECPDCDNRGVLIGEGSEAYRLAANKISTLAMRIPEGGVCDLLAIKILEAAFPKKGLPS